MWELAIRTVKSRTNFFFLRFADHASHYISVMNHLDAQNVCFTIGLFHASTCFEHMCSSSGGQNSLRSLWYHTETSERSEITKTQFITCLQ